MATELRSQVIQPPYDGIDTDSSIDSMPATKAPVVDNFLTHYPGKAPIRGGINDGYVALGLTGADKPIGAWVDTITLKVIIGVQPDNSTIADDTSTGKNLRIINLGLQTNAGINAVASLTPGPKVVNCGGYHFGYALSPDTSSDRVADQYGTVGGGPYQRYILQWNGQSVAPTPMTHWTFSGADLTYWQNRLWSIGGQGAGAAIYEYSTLFFSDAFAAAATPPANAVTSWQDDVSGLLNRIIVGDGDQDQGVGLARLGNTMVVFKQRSVWLVTGSGPSTFAVKQVSHNHGCIDARSIVELDEAVYFMSDQGYIAFDGVTFVNVSSTLRSSLLKSAMTNKIVFGGRCIATALPNGYIGISVGRSSSGSNPDTSTTDFCGLFNATRGTWTTFSSGALPGAGCPIAFLRVDSASPSFPCNTYLLCDNALVRADYLTQPELQAAADRGKDKFNGSSSPIPAKWRSKLVSLASPSSRSQLQRFLFDYNFEVNGAADDANDGWYVTLVTGDSTTAQAQYQVPAGGDSSVHTYRRRHSKDCFAEANDLQVQVEWKSSALALTRAELLPSYVLYQVTRARPRE